jgi:hypothetical protein
MLVVARKTGLASRTGKLSAASVLAGSTALLISR